MRSLFFAAAFMAVSSAALADSPAKLPSGLDFPAPSHFNAPAAAAPSSAVAGEPKLLMKPIVRKAPVRKRRKKVVKTAPAMPAVQQDDVTQSTLDTNSAPALRPEEAPAAAMAPAPTPPADTGVNINTAPAPAAPGSFTPGDPAIGVPPPPATPPAPGTQPPPALPPGGGPSP